MSQQPTTTSQPIAPIAPIDPEPIAQSDTSTAVILAVAILLSITIGSITQLVQVILTTNKSR
jgi:hypothetical protein